MALRGFCIWTLQLEIEFERCSHSNLIKSGRWAYSSVRCAHDTITSPHILQGINFAIYCNGVTSPLKYLNSCSTGWHHSVKATRNQIAPENEKARIASEVVSNLHMHEFVKLQGVWNKVYISMSYCRLSKQVHSKTKQKRSRLTDVEWHQGMEACRERVFAWWLVQVLKGLPLHSLLWINTSCFSHQQS